MVGEGTRGGRERRREGGREQGDGGRGNKGRDGEERVRGGREEARTLHRHEASVEEGRVEGGRVGDGNKRGRNGAWHGQGGRKRAGVGLREERMEQGSKE